jgi:hypothetical protein
MRIYSTFIFAALTLPSSAILTNAPAVQFEGCYIFDRPLGSSASGNLERSDSAWYSLELRENGVIARPQLQNSFWRQRYARSSSWRTTADTLHIVVSTGLVGWRIWLVRENGELRGVAGYLTDVVAADYVPPRVPVRARKVTCAAALTGKGPG